MPRIQGQADFYRLLQEAFSQVSSMLPAFVGEHRCSPPPGVWLAIPTEADHASRSRYECPECGQHFSGYASGEPAGSTTSPNAPPSTLHRPRRG